MLLWQSPLRKTEQKRLDVVKEHHPIRIQHFIRAVIRQEKALLTKIFQFNPQFRERRAVFHQRILLFGEIGWSGIVGNGSGGADAAGPAERVFLSETRHSRIPEWFHEYQRVFQRGGGVEFWWEVEVKLQPGLKWKITHLSINQSINQSTMD